MREQRKQRSEPDQNMFLRFLRLLLLILLFVPVRGLVLEERSFRQRRPRYNSRPLASAECRTKNSKGASAKRLVIKSGSELNRSKQRKQRSEPDQNIFLRFLCFLLLILSLFLSEVWSWKKGHFVSGAPGTNRVLSPAQPSSGRQPSVSASKSRNPDAHSARGPVRAPFPPVRWRGRFPPASRHGLP